MTEELPPSISELLACRPFLERLALHLTGERESADDLVQDALLVAIERPPRHGTNLPAWFESVVRHLHYRRKQRGTFVKTTELDPVLPSDEVSTDEIAERAELLRSVAEVMLGLKEPYRGVLVLRFYEGKTPTEIAAQLGRPVNTVTSQLARGIQQLESELDRQHGGDRSRWIQALLPLALPRERREANAPLPPPPGASGNSLRRLALGAGALLATSVVALLSIDLWERPSPVEGASKTVAARPVVEPALEADVAAGQGREPIAVVPDPPSPAPHSTPPSEGSWLEVVDPAGAPIAGARIIVTRPDLQQDADLTNYESNGDVTTWKEVTRTDEQGRARFVPRAENVVSLFDERYVGVLALAPGYARSLAHYVPFPPRSSAPLRISLEGPALTVRGRVIDADGIPAGADVFIGAEEGSWGMKDGIRFSRRNMGVSNDPRGNFVYDGLVPGQNRVVIRGQGFVPLEDSIAAPAGTIERTFLLDRGAHVRGWVVTKEGQPVPRAEIWAEYMLPRIRPMFVRYIAGDDATFDLPGIPRGLVRILAQHPSDPLLTDSVFLSFSGNEEKEWMPELDHRPPVRLKVVTDEGQPVAQAGIRIINEGGREWFRVFATDDEGVLSIPALPVANYLVDVFRSAPDIPAGDLPLATSRKVVVGENTLVIPRADLEGGGLRGRIVAPPEQLERTPLIYLRPLGGHASGATPVDPETGIYSRDPITPRPYEVILFVQRLGIAPLGMKEVRANETLDLGDFVVPAVGTVEVDWRWKGEESEYSYQLVAIETAEAWPNPVRWRLHAGQGPPSGAFQVLPGRFEWTVSREGKTVEHRELEVQPGSVFPLTTGAEDETR